jgi:hypothetical protein
MRHVRLFVALMVLAAAAPARATVDALLDYQVPYQHLQTDDVCFLHQTMWAEIGIPPASLMRAVFAPNQIFNETGLPTPYVNINLAATHPAMVASYVSDSYAGNVLTYEMSLDVTKLEAANGSTVAGRSATVKSAKLALLAVARSVAGLAGAGSWKLRVTFVGLPSQTGLTGTKLYATTQYAYGPGSPLLTAYEQELINVGGSCPH